MNGRVCLSFDVEEWFQVENLRSVFPRESWNSQQSRVCESTKRILDLLSENGISATFFILGCIAEKFPDLVKDISSQGHEVASHGYSHAMNDGLSRECIFQDISRSKKLLEDISGKEVVGYRAPSFSINEDLLEVLADLGFVYDSSFHDFGSHDRYGHLGSCHTQEPFIHPTGIIEIPISICRFLGMKVPIGGGGYFRLLPFSIYSVLVRKQIGRTGLLAFYLHPWEIDDGQPRVRIRPRSYEFRHYVNIENTYEKLQKLIGFFIEGDIELIPYHQITEKSK